MKRQIREAHEMLRRIVTRAIARRVADQHLNSSMMITVPAVHVREVEEEDDDEQGASLTQPLSLQPDYGSKRASQDALTPEMVEKWRKEFLLLMRNVKKVKDYDTGVQFLEVLSRWRANFDRWTKSVYQDLEGRHRIDSNEGWLQKYKTDLKVVWELLYELRNPPLSRANKYRTEDMQFREWEDEHKKWEARIKRKARPAWKYLTELSEWALRGGLYGGGEAPVLLNNPRMVNQNLGGFQVRVLDEHIGDLSALDDALRKYKEAASKTFPWLIRYQLPIVVGRTHNTDTAASYDGSVVRIDPVTIATQKRKPREFVRILAHEMAHHVYQTYLSGDMRSFWDKAVRGDYKTLDLRDVASRIRSGESSYEFADRMRTEEPLLSLQVEALYYDQNQNMGLLSDLEDYLGRGGDPLVRVPEHPITRYANKNPEETFCEAIGVLVGYGPQRLFPAVKGWLRTLLPSLRVSSLTPRR